MNLVRPYGLLLKKAISTMMIFSGFPKLRLSITLSLFAVTSMAVATSPVFAQGSALQQIHTGKVQPSSNQSSALPDWQAAAGGKMSFDVASIKPSKPDTFMRPNMGLNSEDYFQPTGGLFSADFPLMVYITFAYKLILSSEQTESMLNQMPKWAATQSFTIQARAAGNPTKDQYRLMMQSLLAERFKLVVHFEKRDTPVLGLMLVKPGNLGSKLRPHADGPPCSENDKSTETSPFICGRYNLITEPNRKLLWGSRDATLSMMAAYLSLLPPRNIGRIIVDRTGLSGSFDFTLEWIPTLPSPAPVAMLAEPDSLGPTLEEALNEQLGLKLKPARAPLSILVIDHVEMPSGN